MLKRLVICGGITVVLTACGNANWTSVYRTYQPASDNSNRGTSALIDAKQRTIIAANRDSGVIICAEPSPDAFSAVSSSFSGSASFSGETSPEAALALSLALNEAAGQLRRARTVQLLRDSLFRACEAYLNGAMDSIDYARIANKYADATVTLLAIEQLTSPDTGPSTVIAPGKTQAQSEASVPGQPGENQPTPTDGNQPPSPGPGQPASPAPNPNPDAGAGGNASESSNPDEPVPPAGGNASASTEPPSPPRGGGSAADPATAGVSVEVANVVGDLVASS